MVKKYLLLFTAIFCLQNTWAQVGGKYVYSFLDLTVPARTAALGGNTIALRDGDINTVFQNPALLSSKMDNNLAFNFVKYLGDIKYAYVAYAKSFDKIGHFAAGIQQVGYGSFSQRDEYGNEIGFFHANDYSFNLSFGREKDSVFSYGVTLKTIYSAYAQYTSIGNALDIGFHFNPGKHKRFWFAGVISNLGYQWKTYTGNKAESLPMHVKLALAYKVPKAPFRLILGNDYLNNTQLTYTDPNNPPATVDPFTHEPIKQHPFKKKLDNVAREFTEAIEILLTQNFNLRVGFNYKRRQELVLTDKQGLAGFSFGLGFKISKFQFSYAYSQYSPVFGANYFSVTTNLSSFLRANKTQAPAASPN